MRLGPTEIVMLLAATLLGLLVIAGLIWLVRQLTSRK